MMNQLSWTQKQKKAHRETDHSPTESPLPSTPPSPVCEKEFVENVSEEQYLDDIYGDISQPFEQEAVDDMIPRKEPGATCTMTVTVVANGPGHATSVREVHRDIREALTRIRSWSGRLDELPEVFEVRLI